MTSLFERSTHPLIFSLDLDAIRRAIKKRRSEHAKHGFLCSSPDIDQSEVFAGAGIWDHNAVCFANCESQS